MHRPLHFVEPTTITRYHQSTNCAFFRSKGHAISPSITGMGAPNWNIVLQNLE